MASETCAALALSLVPGLTRSKLRRLHHHFGTFDAVLASAGGLLPPPLQAVMADFRKGQNHYLEQARDLLDAYRQQGIVVLCVGDKGYPPLLAEINQLPPLLFLRGNAALLTQPQVAVVGSRHATRGGIDHARHFARGLAEAGFVVTSGLALGVDGAAHQGALAVPAGPAGGNTIAVLGCGVDVIYPRRHARLYEAIVDSGGLLVSELAPGTGVRAEYFPQRNRVISGLSLGVLVVEAAPRSGSLITARLAMEQGREVFAIPGSIHNVQARGCHQLIRDGATLVESLDDMAAQLDGLLAYVAETSGSGPQLPTPGNDAEARLLELMGFEPVMVDELAALSGWDASTLTATLVGLELQGYVEARGGAYVRLS